MVNSHRKGGNGEREVLKILRDAFGGKWERRSLGIPGPDLIAPDTFPFAVEVKNEKTVRCIHLFAKPSMKLQEFWQQASSQADALDKMPLLVVKAERIWFASSQWGHWFTLEEWIKLVGKGKTIDISPTHKPGYGHPAENIARQN